MIIVYLIMIIGGIILIGISLWAVHYRAGPMAWLVALLAPLGLFLTLLGVLLLSVPDFFFPSQFG